MGKFRVAAHRDEDDVWVVECPAIPGCVSQGPTKSQAFHNIKEAIALYLEVREEQGPPPSSENTRASYPRTIIHTQDHFVWRCYP